MKRTQHNLFIIMSVMMAICLLITRLPPPIALGVAGAILVVVLLLAALAYDFFVARHHTKRGRWRAAAGRYEKFEKKLVQMSWLRTTVLVYLTIYTFDAIAIVRNEVAQSLLNLDEFETAERWLKGALERDLQYAEPYVNLAAIAAIRRDAVTAKRHISRAVGLGYSPEGAQQVLRRALARGHAQGNSSAGNSLEK